MPRTTRSNAKKTKGAHPPRQSAHQKKLAHALRDLEFPSGNDGAAEFQGCQTRDDEFKVVKKIYHAGCLQHHPDKGGDSEIFRRIHAAFSLLKDLHKKKGSWLFSDVFASDNDNNNSRAGAKDGDDDDDDTEEFDFATYYADFTSSFSNSPPPSWEFYQEAAEEPVPLYRVELAKSARSKCSAKPSPFKKCGANLCHGKNNLDQCTDVLPVKDVSQSIEKIEKGEIRIGWVNKQTGTYNGWVHLRCWRVPIKVWLGLPQSETATNDQFAAAIARMEEILLTGFDELPHTDQQNFIEYCRDKENWGVARTEEQIALVKSVQGENITGKVAVPKKKKKKTAGKKNGKAKKVEPTEDATSQDQDSKADDEEMMETKPAAKTAPPAAVASAASTSLVPAASASLVNVRQRQQFVVPIPNRNGASDETVFKGKTFVLTGTFPEIGGGQGLDQGKAKVKAMITSFGGRVTGSVSGKTDVLVVGKAPGMSKVGKARGRETCKLGSLHDVATGLHNGLAALEDFDFVKSEEPMKIQSFSKGYEKASGYNGLALQACTEELAIAQGFVPPGGHKAKSPSKAAAAKLPSLEASSDAVKSSAKAPPMLALPGPSHEDEPMPDAKPAAAKKAPKKKAAAKKKTKAAPKEEENESKPATKKAAPKKKTAPKKRQALSDVSGNADGDGGEVAETPDIKKAPAAKKRKTTRAKAVVKEEASPEF